MSLVNTPIADTFILRDDANVAIVGKVAADFAVIESYLLPSGATTAVVTLTEIGGGEYATAFTPTAVGTWTIHLVYNAGGVFREFSQTYEVVGQVTNIVGDTSVTYATLAELKARLDVADVKDDTILDQVLRAASRQIDGMTNDVFYQIVAETRTYTTEWSDALVTDSLVSVTSLVTDENGDRVYETTWATTDYDLMPDNAAELGHPFTSLVLAPNGLRAFPTGRRAVRITGTWGWPAVPPAVREACLIQAVRYFTRKSAPYGVAGSAELGQAQIVIPSADPDVKALVSPFRRFSVSGV